ncbi:LysR family transcriptional regulator [Vibrio hippocampi]|uniref:HTH-type transcriptional regulator CysL n=1 Tax=Vibrio hippocampi TaxID=654686 RepID=A0ABM8ZMF1_9VIBR|nr:LysR family transcriptional regulator [Vibrio hippocampi]CAH0529721.1 HTH-type transcriptional regulator CysL [Vibrio hippocampi]
MLNAQWLNTFKTLVEVGHFTHTAEKLFMTQPGVSQQIKKLEAAVNCALIIREGKSFELTEQGQLVYQYALEANQQQQQLLEKIKFDDPYQGEWRLSAPGAIATALYSELLTLQKLHPKLSTHMEAAPNRKIIADVLEGSIDLGIVTYQPHNSDLTCEAIGVMELALVGPKHYQSQGKLLDDLNILGVVDHPDARHYFEKVIEAGDVAIQAEFDWEQLPKATYINQFSQILHPVMQGIGMTVIPKIAITEAAANQSLQQWKTSKAISDPLYLIRRKRRALPARYQLLLETIRNQTFK